MTCNVGAQPCVIRLAVQKLRFSFSCRGRASSSSAEPAPASRGAAGVAGLADSLVSCSKLHSLELGLNLNQLGLGLSSQPSVREEQLADCLLPTSVALGFPMWHTNLCGTPAYKFRKAPEKRLKPPSYHDPDRLSRQDPTDCALQNLRNF